MLPINPKVPLALTIVCALAMVGVTAWQGYGFWQSLNQQDGQSDVARVAPPAAQKHSAPSAPMANFALFGTATPSDEQALTNTEDLPETNLRIFLRGVLAAEGQFPGSALIEDAKNKTEVFLVGDELPGNARLRSVHPNRVVLDRGGKRENLYFPEPDDRAGMTFSASASDRAGEDTSYQPPAGSNRSASPESASDNQARREEIRKRLELLRERLRTNG